MTQPRSSFVPGEDPDRQDVRPQPDPDAIDPPPAQDEIPEDGTTVGQHETAPEEIGESG